MASKSNKEFSLIQEFPKIYEAISTTYHNDRFSTKFGIYDLQETIVLLQEVFQELQLNPLGLCMIDVGSGTGKISLPIARMGADVVCLDASQGMLTQCYQRARSDGVEKQIHLLQASANDIPSRDAQYDLVVSSRFLHLFPPTLYPLFIEEMLRIVKPKGYIVIEVKNKYAGFALNFRNEFLKKITGGTPSSSISLTQASRIIGEFNNASIINIKGCQLPKAHHVKPNTRLSKVIRQLSRSILKPLAYYYFIIIQKHENQSF